MREITELVPVTYHDGENAIRIGCFADTLVYYTVKEGEHSLVAMRFGGYPEQVFSNLAAVAGDGEIEVGISGSHAVFMKKGVLFCAKRLPGEYVDVDTLISSVKPALTVKTECDELKTALLDICGVATVGNDSSYICLKFGENAIEISTQNANCGGERTVSCVTIDGDAGKSFHYSVSAMRDALKTVDGSLIMQVDERGYLLVFDRENKYMTVPISQHAVKRKAEAIREKRTKHRAEQKVA